MTLAIDGGDPVSPQRINLVKPTFTEKDEQDICKILRSAYVRQGPYTKRFEEEFAQKVGAEHAYAVSSGTAALHLAYLTTLHPGDEVICPAFTFIATAAMVHYANAKPVIADIDPETFLLSPESVAEKITPKTRAIAPVHLFGNSCNMKALNELAEDHGLTVINDCAQAHGTTYKGKDLGSFETLNCYSFYPTKTMTMGEGGLVTTNSEKLYKKGCLLRSHGDDARYHHVTFGLNYRTTDIAAAIGLNQLAQLDSFIEKRRAVGKKLREAMEAIPGVAPQRIEPGTDPSYSYFSVRLDTDSLNIDREGFMNALQAENIDCAVHYPIALTEQPIFKETYKPEPCPESEALSRRILSLPMHPYLTEQETDYVIEGVEKVASYYAH